MLAAELFQWAIPLEGCWLAAVNSNRIKSNHFFQLFVILYKVQYSDYLLYNDEYSTPTSLNRWLAYYCHEYGFGFVDNWPSFWGQLKADRFHSTGIGATLI